MFNLYQFSIFLDFYLLFLFLFFINFYSFTDFYRLNGGFQRGTPWDPFLPPAAATTIPHPPHCLARETFVKNDELGRTIDDARSRRPQGVVFKSVIELCDSYISKRFSSESECEDSQCAIEKASSLGLRVPPIKQILFVSFRHESRKTAEQHPEACLQPLDHDPELVFTHTDLAPRNLILEDGTDDLWVVDWDEAGFYPRYFEYAGMHNFYVPEGWTWLARLRWRFFAWLVAGSWARERRFLSEALRKARRFGASR
ncbi:hypothetical protein GGTG_06583 [Gaeumannomyces tritici R3-111a-1]|uniref:Aminoglycoside phosphotransferase domain-containing protein n=1 Tax=Gaeumannomyces tritici (strain R3-111a-1) TaxID=644352 RepID=J3NZ83_GAET3|nr:hypothetical protein GGTG_06583 [Gaeumannomyces tritici R3-111a-1]EJT76666.1 hypothetical protein GGTG_06583 [Gaeumannomyces tritici R3-111a-1]